MGSCKMVGSVSDRVDGWVLKHRRYVCATVLSSRHVHPSIHRSGFPNMCPPLSERNTYTFIHPTNLFRQVWTLALLGRCHLVAGEAVTAEGLLRAALDGLGTVGEEARGTSATNLVGGLTASPLDLFPSPLHPFSKAESLRAYSELLMQWEKREAEGEGVLRRAEKVMCDNS